jgi:hypothetical protein
MSIPDDQFVYMTITERLEVQLRELRASHDALQIAAKIFLLEQTEEKANLLQVAINAAEELAP